MTFFLGRAGRDSPGSKTSSGKSKLSKVEPWISSRIRKTYLRTWMIDKSLIPGWNPGHDMHVDLKI